MAKKMINREIIRRIDRETDKEVFNPYRSVKRNITDNKELFDDTYYDEETNCDNSTKKIKTRDSIITITLIVVTITSLCAFIYTIYNM